MSMSSGQTAPRSVMDWPAIFAGAVIAAAVMVVLTGFTAAIGLGSVSARPDEGLGTLAAILGGLFAFAGTIAAYALGGYIALPGGCAVAWTASAATKCARSVAVWTAFLLAVSAFVAGVAAFLVAIRGGRDRDEGRVWAGLHRGFGSR